MREKSLLFVLFIIGAFLMSSVSYSQDKINVNPNKRDGQPYIVAGPQTDNASPLSESFEGVTFPPAGWIKQSVVGNVTATWNRYTIGQQLPGWNPGFAVVTGCPGGGNASAGVTYGEVASSNNEWLITPQITNVQPGDSLSFWVRYMVPAYADSLSVYISTTTQTVGAMTTLVWSKRFFGASDTSWAQYKFRLGNFVSAGANIYIGFREHVANNLADGSAITLDLVNVTASTPAPPSTWWEQTTPVTTTLYSVSAATNEIVWACGAAGRVVMTTNGGTWVNATGTGIPAALALYNIWAINATTALVTGSDAVGTYVYRTSNSGTTWTQVFTQPGGFINVMLMSDATTGWMQGDPVSNRWSLWRTTNGGVNWDSTGRFLAMTGSEAGWNNSANWVGNNIWFGTNNTKVYFSSNNGVNWTGQALGELNSYAVNFNAAGTGFAGGALLRMSTNNGTTWGANTTLGTGNFTGIANNGDQWWQVRQTGTGIYYSSNNGTNWTQQHTAPAGTFTFITKSRTGTMLYAVRSNGSVSKYGWANAITPINEIAADYKLSQNYPNPFNPATKINFSLPKNGFVTLKVYDILGKEVATLVNEFKNSGTYAVDFNAVNLASGVYLYKIEADGFVDTKRMMLIK